MGAGACLLFPQGALYNEHLIHIGAETIVGPGCLHFGGHGAGTGDADRPRGVHRQPQPHRDAAHTSSANWEIVLGDDIQTGPYVVHHGSETHTLRRSGRADRKGSGPTGGPGAHRLRAAGWVANAVILPGAQIGGHVGGAAGAVVRRRRCRTAAWSRGVPARIVKPLGGGRGLGHREGRRASMTEALAAVSWHGERAGRPGPFRRALRRAGPSVASP